MARSYRSQSSVSDQSTREKLADALAVSPTTTATPTTTVDGKALPICLYLYDSEYAQPLSTRAQILGLKGEESLISSSVECVAGTMAAASGWAGASVLGRPTDLLRTSDHRSDVPRLIDAMRPRSIGSARSVPQPDGHTSPWCQCYTSVCLAC